MARPVFQWHSPWEMYESRGAGEWKGHFSSGSVDCDSSDISTRLSRLNADSFTSEFGWRSLLRCDKWSTSRVVQWPRRRQRWPKFSKLFGIWHEGKQGNGHYSQIAFEHFRWVGNQTVFNDRSMRIGANELQISWTDFPLNRAKCTVLDRERPKDKHGQFLYYSTSPCFIIEEKSRTGPYKDTLESRRMEEEKHPLRRLLESSFSGVV